MESKHEEHVDPNYMGSFNKMVRLKNTDTWITHRYVDFGSHKCMDNFPVNDDDVFVASFPKSGTTWVQEIVYLMCNDVDLVKAREKTIDERFPFMDFKGWHEGEKAMTRFAEMPSPRYLMTHLQYESLPDITKKGRGKVVYVARNAKDVVCSFYPFSLNNMGYNGTFDEFFEAFVNGKVAFGSWSSNVLSYWKRRNDDNVFFLTYEEMQKDKEGVIDKLAAFLGKTLTQTQRQLLIENTSFSAMKANPSTNKEWLKEKGITKGDAHVPFMRKGKVGGWKDDLTKEHEEQIDKMYKKYLEPEGLYFIDNLK